MSKLGGRSIESDVRRLRVLLTKNGHIYKTKVSADDTTPGFLSDKITSVDSSVAIAVANDGADEDLDLSVSVYVAAEIADHASDPDAHHNQSHVLATTSGLGPDHTVSGLTARQVLVASGATTALFRTLQSGDLPTGATLSVSSTNDGTSHAITTSNAVTTATAVILATDSNGRAQVRGAGFGVAPTGNNEIAVGSRVFVNETASTDVTNGLILNQGAADDAIIVLMSSDVAHGMTDAAETDVYGYIGKSGNGDNVTGFDAGGLLIVGLRDADANASRALVMAGYLGEAADTTTAMGNGGSLGVVQMTSAVKSGTGLTTVADTGNMWAVLNYGYTNLLMKGNGDLYKRGELQLTDDDVAHGVTDVAITSAYTRVYPFSGTDGGAIYAGLSESVQALGLFGIATSSSTGKTTSGTGAVEVRAYLKSGTNVTTHGADANLFIIRNGTTTRWIVDAEGDTHRDGTSNTFDTYHDAHLARAFDRIVSPGSVVDSEFDAWVDYGRDDLVAAGILHKSGFYNESRLLRLAIGAVWQEYTERQRLALRVQELERRLLN